MKIQKIETIPPMFDVVTNQVFELGRGSICIPSFPHSIPSFVNQKNFQIIFVKIEKFILQAGTTNFFLEKSYVFLGRKTSPK